MIKIKTKEIFIIFLELVIINNTPFQRKNENNLENYYNKLNYLESSKVEVINHNFNEVYFIMDISTIPKDYDKKKLYFTVQYDRNINRVEFEWEYSNANISSNIYSSLESNSISEKGRYIEEYFQVEKPGDNKKYLYIKLIVFFISPTSVTIKNTKSEPSGSKVGIWIAIIFGAIFLAIIIITIVYCIWKNKKLKSTKKEEKKLDEQNPQVQFFNGQYSGGGLYNQYNQGQITSLQYPQPAPYIPYPQVPYSYQEQNFQPPSQENLQNQVLPYLSQDIEKKNDNKDEMDLNHKAIADPEG